MARRLFPLSNSGMRNRHRWASGPLVRPATSRPTRLYRQAEHGRPDLSGHIKRADGADDIVLSSAPEGFRHSLRRTLAHIGRFTINRKFLCQRRRAERAGTVGRYGIKPSAQGRQNGKHGRIILIFQHTHNEMNVFAGKICFQRRRHCFGALAVMTAVGQEHRPVGTQHFKPSRPPGLGKAPARCLVRNVPSPSGYADLPIADRKTVALQ